MRLAEKGFRVNRKRGRRLMRNMGLRAVYPRPNLSKRYHAQYVHPYLLRNLDIIRPNQVWGVDITYIRMHKGFMYLFVIIDWYSRKIIDYELSSTIDKAFVLTCLKPAFATKKTGNHEQRSRQPLYQFGLRRIAQGARDSDLDGRQGTGHRQQQDRAIFPLFEVRVHLLERVPVAKKSKVRTRRIHRFLQP